MNRLLDAFIDNPQRGSIYFDPRKNYGRRDFIMHPVPAALLFAYVQLTHLAFLDVLILALYFAFGIFIGFYVKGWTNTIEELFLASPEMSAWIAGFSFMSANLGSLELMGWAGCAYQIRYLSNAPVWDWSYSDDAIRRNGNDAVLLHFPFALCSGVFKPRSGESARGLSPAFFALAILTTLNLPTPGDHKKIQVFDMTYR